MSTFEEINFNWAIIEILDDTPTTPLKATLRLRSGDATLTGGRSPYLHASHDTQSNNRHTGTTFGERLYPQFGVSARTDKLAGDNTVLDAYNETPGGTFASAVNTDPNSPVPHRHIVIKWTTPVSAVVRSLALESCDLTGLDFTDGQEFLRALTAVVKGRVFADGVCIMREWGASTTLPSWAPAAPA